MISYLILFCATRRTLDVLKLYMYNWEDNDFKYKKFKLMISIM